MEEEGQLFSQEICAPECTGIDAPELIQRDIIADEEIFPPKSISVNIDEVDISEHVTEAQEIESTTKKVKETIIPHDKTITEDGEEIVKQDTSNVTAQNSSDINDISAKKEDKMNGSQFEPNKNNDKYKLLNKNSDSKDVKDNKNECENRDVAVTEGTIKNEDEVQDYHHEVLRQDGNNNAEAKRSGSKKDDGVRRTRFSLESTNQTKASCRPGNDTIVMMQPGFDEVFRDSNQSLNSSSTSSNAVTCSKETQVPRSFLPLTAITCMFCPMIGIFAIYKSFAVKHLIQNGDIRKANEASLHARQLGLLTLFIGFFFFLAIAMIAVLVSVISRI